MAYNLGTGFFQPFSNQMFEGMNKKELSGKITGMKKIRYSEGD